MKITVNSPIARIEAHLPEDHVKDLLQLVIERVTGRPGAVLQPVDAPAADVPAPKIIIPGDSPKPQGNHTEPGYRGFLYVKCEECGTTKGFCAKAPLQEYRCDCGHKTPLSNLKPMYVNCECGENFKYLTNLTDATASMDCIRCGSPVDLEFHDKKGVYQTIK